MSVLQSPMGLIAGNGAFPVEFARSAQNKGLEVVAIAHRGETDQSLEKLVSKVLWVRVGQLGKTIDFFKRLNVRQVAFAGGISRIRLFGGIRLDLKAILLLSRIKSVRDDALLRGVASEIEKNGIEVISAGEVLEHCLPKAGVLTTRAPTSTELHDAKIGWDVAKAIGGLDIGQTVVVVDGLVVSVEAVEGTDAAIQRAGDITRAGANKKRRSFVVVKVSKPSQDLRIDLPTIGMNTISTMKKAGAGALVIEAGKTIMLDPDAVVREANQADIAILVVGE